MWMIIATRDFKKDAKILYNFMVRSDNSVRGFDYKDLHSTYIFFYLFWQNK